MRIVPVTGDLPAVVVPPPAAPPVGRAPAAPPPVVVAATAARGAGSEHPSHRPPARAPLPFFDPPLIAQRAALGLPVGLLIADVASREGVPCGAVAAAVDDQLDERTR